MLQAVMEDLVEGGMRFNRWKNRNRHGFGSSKVLLHSKFPVQPSFRED